MILNENKYIFINHELWELICDKDNQYEDSIMYKVNSNDITFSLDNIELSFKHNNNIIDKNAFKNSSRYNKNYKSIYESNYDKLKVISNSVIKYYNFENKILDDLKKQSNNSTSYEFLISKEWIDNWKKFSNYENIKTKYLQNNKFNNQDDILIYLIYYLEENKLNYDELSISINNLKFSKKEEIESYLKKDSLVLINSLFLYCFNNYSSENFIKYNAFNNKIHFYFDKNEILSFKSNNNIISINIL